MSTRIHVFIISWAGKHEQACAIAREVGSAAEQLTIVYSDPDPDLELLTTAATIKRPNSLFWGDKFKTCIDHCAEPLMLVLHADCSCNDWVALVKTCRLRIEQHPEIGIWSPQIEGTPFPLDKTELRPVDDTLTVVTFADPLCIAIKRPIVERMKQFDYSQNIYGWGIGFAFHAYAFGHNLVPVIDRSIQVVHDTHQGYPKEMAREQRNEFLKQMSTNEMSIYLMMRNYYFSKGGTQV